MTISSSLNAGVAGLAANASRLATISDNIANSATNGYKRAEADFHSMVSGASGGAFTAGGVRVTSQRQIDQSGSLASTASPTDLAVRGRGFLPVVSETALANGGAQQMLLTTTGSFKMDEDGLLKTSAGHVLMGWPADAEGNVPVNPRDTTAALQPIQIETAAFTAMPTTEISLGVNLPATDTGPATTGAPRDLAIEYFDNLGSSQTLDLQFVPQAVPNEWQLVITDAATGNTVGDYQLAFDAAPGSGGTLASVTDNVTATPVAVGDPLQVQTGTAPNVNDIAIALDESISQLGDRFAPTTITKDGAPVGSMVSIEVDSAGYLSALFDTGISKTLYQIPVVDVPNPNGLTALDSQAFLPSNESGDFFLWDAGTGPTGDVASYALEESTVDVAGELTSLIQTQRAYSSNAKVIQTVDEMLQETTNLKR